MRRARFGRCKHCHGFTAHKCHRCGEWLCVFQGAPCGKLRKVKGEVGRYDLVCAPRCRKTRKDIGVPKRPRGWRDDLATHERVGADGFPEVHHHPEFDS